MAFDCPTVDVQTASEAESWELSGERTTTSSVSTRQSTTKSFATPAPAAYDHGHQADNKNNTRDSSSRHRALASEHDLPEMSPEAFHHIRDPGQNSPGTHPPEHWAYPPVSFIPATSPSGPRELAPDRYNCPVRGCPNPHGALNPNSANSRRKPIQRNGSRHSIARKNPIYLSQ